MNQKYKDFLVIFLLIMALIMVLSSCSGEDSVSTPDKNIVSTTVSVPKRTLLTAIDQDKMEIIRQHMDAGTDPNDYSPPVGLTMLRLQQFGAVGAYPLHLAVIKDSQEIVQVLIDGGASLDINTNNEDGFTPLHWAAYYCLKDMASLLIDLGSPVNALDTNNDTSLDVAVIGEEIGASFLAEKREQESDPSKSTFSIGGDQLVPGCSAKSEVRVNRYERIRVTEEDAEEAKKRLDDFIAILKTHGGKASKDL